MFHVLLHILLELCSHLKFKIICLVQLWPALLEYFCVPIKVLKHFFSVYNTKLQNRCHTQIRETTMRKSTTNSQNGVWYRARSSCPIGQDAGSRTVDGQTLHLPLPGPGPYPGIPAGTGTGTGSFQQEGEIVINLNYKS